jgi:arylsulfatase A-like enzyme
VADDLGYGQVSSYPHEEIYHTPNIDRLARGGVRMTDGYSAHPMWWPSGGALLTGRYYQRFLRAHRRDAYDPGRGRRGHARRPRHRRAKMAESHRRAW